MKNNRYILGVLALLALLFIPAINAHAQGAGNGDGGDVYTHVFSDGTSMADFINMTSSDQEALVLLYAELNHTAPIGLTAAMLSGYHDGGWGTGAEGYGTGAERFYGYVGIGPNGNTYDGSGSIPTTFDVYSGGFGFDPWTGTIWYYME